MLSFTYDGVDSFDAHHYQHRSPSLMSTFTASSSLFPSPSSYGKRETSRLLFDYASPSTPTRSRSEGEWRQQQAEDPKTQGDLAKVDHDHVIYGALLEECNDTSNCIGVASGCYKAHGWNSWQVARRDPRKFNYGSKLCSFFAEGSCQKGDQCSFAHSKTEVQFHPKVYKTQACNRYTGSRYCGNKLCAFYHIFDDGSDDSRKPLPEENNNNNGGSGSPTGSLAFDDHVWLDRTSIFKPTPPPQFLDMSLLGEPVRRTLKRSNSSSDKVNLDNRSVSNHWSLEFLDAKMKNPNRKESQFGLNLLAWVPDFPLRELIKTLYDESWTVEQLRSYLSHTLVRALEERKVVVSDSGSFAGFNTGLVPPNASYCMIAVLTYSPVQQGTKFEWTLTHFKSPNEVVSSKFLPTVPPPVCYMDNKSDMWFDANKRILSFGEPLLTRVVDRIAEVRPEVVDLDVFIQMAILEKAMKNTEATVLQNPSLAVPSFYRPKGQLYGSVQFLLPISFSDDPTRVDGALAVQERVTGYVACTVLSLQDAYAHARLIGKPSVDWLNGASINNNSAEPVIKRQQSEEKTLLDKIGSTQLYYHENSVPRVIIVPNDDAGDKEIRESIVAFAKKASLSQYSVRRVDVSGKQALEMYLNHNDYIRMLKSYGRMSSLEVYLKNFFSVN